MPIEAEQAIGILSELLARIPMVRQAKRDGVEVKMFLNDVDVALRNMFGENSVHIVTARRISFRPARFSADELARSLAFSSGLNSVEALIRSSISEVRQFWDVREAAEVGVGYYEGLVCENAHKVARRTFGNHAEGTEYCDQCGAKAHCQCPSCRKMIRGGEVPATIDNRRNASADDKTWPLPWYCYACGQAYPWTQRKIDAAQQLVDELEELTTFEREGLKTSIPDLMSQTPNSDLAAIRWRQAIGKVSAISQQILVKLLADIAAESIKKALGI
ncbi:MAG: DUF2321 domain-containing protein [Phycisphaerae bacterium]|nr:DUF2321 domain-containing protein [Phycisphaerae bacterium]